jgi:lysophospholipase L1-like esterase
MVTAAAPTSAADPVLKPNDHIALCGDSITELKGYSVFLEDYMLMCKPAPNIRTTQFGHGGSTVKHFLSSKLQQDVLRFNPTVVTTCFGMNDGGYRALLPDIATNYRNGTQTIIDNFKKANVRTIIIGSPGIVDPDTYNKGTPDQARTYNQTLAALRDIDKELAEKNNVLFADIHSVMFDVMNKAKAKYGNKYHLGGRDGVHPMANGHLVMAYVFLKTLGVDGNIGTITVDLKTNTASATEGHKVTTETLKDNAVEIESSRYPFCFTGKPEDPAATSGVIEFFPFNDDLNRFILVIKNAPAHGATITWGKTSKSFTNEQLTKGINLAAEFLDNPFSEQFKKVHDAVHAQQNFETMFMKTFVANLEQMKSFAAPEDKPAFDRTLTNGMKEVATLHDKAAALVIPIRHTLTIKPNP